MNERSASGGRRTRRQEIARLLRTGPRTAHDLAVETRAHIKTVLLDLEHIRRGLARNERWVVRDAGCNHCGFVFRERRRLNTPSRCPRCRSEDIRAPEFEVRTA